MTGVIQTAVTSVADRDAIPGGSRRAAATGDLRPSRDRTQAAPSQGSSYHSRRLDGLMPGGRFPARANQVR